MDRTPFNDISNSTNADKDVLRSQSQLFDAKERKRERERARYAAMSMEERNDRNKKRREARQRIKVQPLLLESPKCDEIQVAYAPLDKENMCPNDSDEWLHMNRNNTIDLTNVLPDHNLPSGDYTQSCVYNNTSIEFSKAGDDCALHREMNVGTADSSETSTNVISGGVHDTSSGEVHPDSAYNTPSQCESRASYFKDRSLSVTRERRAARQNYFSLYNQTPMRKEAKREYKKKQKELQSNALNHTSIAMENPKYIPEDDDAPVPRQFPISSHDCVIPDLSPSPMFVFPVSTQTDVVPSDMSPRPRNKRHVPPGERQSLLARRNQQFEATIARRLVSAFDTSECMSDEMDDGAQQPPPAKVNNNGTTNEAEDRAEIIDNDGDGVIFEEDDDDDDGYLFAGQDDDNDDDIGVDGPRDDSAPINDKPDLYDKVYSNIPEETHMLKPVVDCGHCGAKKFEYEPPGFCCRSGKIHLSTLETPTELVRLWSSADSDGLDPRSERLVALRGPGSCGRALPLSPPRPFSTCAERPRRIHRRPSTSPPSLARRSSPPGAAPQAS